MTSVMVVVVALGLGQSRGAPYVPGGAVVGAVQLVDPARGLVIMEMPSQGGHRYFEYKIPMDVPLYSKDGQKLEGGLAAEPLTLWRNRISVPLKISFNSQGQIEKLQLQGADALPPGAGPMRSRVVPR